MQENGNSPQPKSGMGKYIITNIAGAVISDLVLWFGIPLVLPVFEAFGSMFIGLFNSALWWFGGVSYDYSTVAAILVCTCVMAYIASKLAEIISEPSENKKIKFGLILSGADILIRFVIGSIVAMWAYQMIHIVYILMMVSTGWIGIFAILKALNKR